MRLLAVPRHGYTGFLVFGPTKCPRCSSRDTVKIVYGAVTPRSKLQAAAGQIRLGGAPSDPERPNRHCRTCANEWETALSRSMRSASPPGA